MSTQCELCNSSENVSRYALPHSPANVESEIHLCALCQQEIAAEALNPQHWRCLNESMWSTVPAVQVLAYRLLSRLSTQGEIWAQDQLDLLYLDDEMKAWADAGIASNDSDDEVPTVDCNGARLADGDSVTLIKDLDVKGAGFTAKRGTMVKGIRLTNNPLHIEGKVNGIQLVLVSAYMKKV